MSYNQSLIKDLRFETVAKAQTRDARGKQAFIAEKGLWYHGVEVVDGTANGIADDDAYIATPVTDVFWKKQEGASGGTPLPGSGEAGAPQDGTTSAINPDVTFADVQGKTAAEALMALHFPIVNPTAVLPVAAFGVMLTSIPKGTAYTNTITATYTKNDGGDQNGDMRLVITGSVSGEVFNGTSSDGTFDVSAVTQLDSIVETFTFALEIDYLEGVDLQDNYGNTVANSKVTQGTATASVTCVPSLSVYHGLQLKGEDLTAKTSAELRTIANGFLAAVDGTSVFTNVTIPNTSDYYFLVPGIKSTVTTVSQGFTITGIASVLGQVDVDDTAGTDSSSYTLIKLAGQAAESIIDTVTIS